MCQNILRVTFVGSDVQTLDVRDGADLDNRVSDLQAKDTVQRIEVFTRTHNLRKTVAWEEAQP